MATNTKGAARVGVAISNQLRSAMRAFTNNPGTAETKELETILQGDLEKTRDRLATARVNQFGNEALEQDIGGGISARRMAREQAESTRDVAIDYNFPKHKGETLATKLRRIGYRASLDKALRLRILDGLQNPSRPAKRAIPLQPTRGQAPA